MQHLYTPFLAQTYGDGPYGECSYQENDCPVTTPSPSTNTGSGSTGSSSGQSGSLVNTGTATAVIIALAAIIIVVAVLIRFWRRKKSLKNPGSGGNITGIGQ